MSTCPEKDLHSLYVDDELPAKYKQLYEEHLAGCEKCRQEMEKTKRLSELLKSDSSALNTDQIFLEQSFARLQTKLNYSKNTSKNSGKIYYSAARWTASFAAAAALLALAVTPVFFNNRSAQQQQINAIARTEIKPISENKPVIDKSLQSASISAALSSEHKETQAEPDYSNQKVISATNLASSSGEFINQLNSVDVFRPDFSKSEPAIRIKAVEFQTMNPEFQQN